MNILDKLKTVDQSRIKDQSINNSINTALGFYEEREALTPSEVSIYERLYNKAINHIEKLEREEEEEKQRIENEQKAEQKAKQEAEQKAKQEAEQKAKQEAEQKAKQEAEQKAKQEAEQKKLKQIKKVMETQYQCETMVAQFNGNVPTIVKKKLAAFKMQKARMAKNPDNQNLLASLNKANDSIVITINEELSKQQAATAQTQATQQTVEETQTQATTTTTETQKKRSGLMGMWFK